MHDYFRGSKHPASAGRSAHRDHEGSVATRHAHSVGAPRTALFSLVSELDNVNAGSSHQTAAQRIALPVGWILDQRDSPHDCVDVCRSTRALWDADQGALNVFTATTAKTGHMSGTLDTVRVLVTEIRTESATAEVALWTISISVAAYVGAAIAGRKARARGADALSAAHGWGATRFAALVAMFALVTVQVSAAGWLTGADAATLDWYAAHRFGAATSVAVVITEVASPVGLAVIAVVTAALVSWRRRSWAPGVLIVGTVVAAAATSTVTKMIVGRPRPAEAAELVTWVDWSYPSGHVTGIVALAGALWVVYGARVRTTSTRVGVGAAAVFVVALVAGTGLYLNGCWLTDVIAGVLLGAAVATAASLVAAVFAVRHLPAASVPTDDLLRRTIADRPCLVSPDAAQWNQGIGHGRRPESTR